VVVRAPRRDHPSPTTVRRVPGPRRRGLLGRHPRVSQALSEAYSRRKWSVLRAVLRHVPVVVLRDPRLPRLRRLSTGRRPRQTPTP